MQGASPSRRLERSACIDFRPRRSDTDRVLKARLSFALLLGALIGLFGQGIAYAAGPSMAPIVAADHAMPDGTDCAGMDVANHSVPERPCRGLTLACIAQMGCVIPMTFEPEQPSAERVVDRRVAATWPPSPMLAGRETTPEPEPPSA